MKKNGKLYTVKEILAQQLLPYKTHASIHYQIKTGKLKAWDLSGGGTNRKLRIPQTSIDAFIGKYKMI